MEKLGPHAIPVSVGASEIHGRGLFAAEPIRQGLVIGEYQGRREHFWHRAYIGHYTMRVDHEDGTVELRNGRFGGNALRFINHSANPNVRTDGFSFVAARDIEAGEELTISYGFGW